MPKPKPVTALACGACNRINEPPYLFCAQCGSPLLKLGKWRVTILLMLAYFVFMGTWVLTEPLDAMLRLGFSLFVWDWPIFLFYNLLVLQLGGWLITGLFKSKMRLFTWNAFSLLAFVIYIEVYHRSEQGDLITYTLSEVPGIAGEYPLIFYPALAAVLTLIFVPALLRWGKCYGWVHAYRLTLITLILIPSIALLVLILLPRLAQVWPEQAAFLKDFMKVRQTYQTVLALVAVSMTRILLFEVFIYASIASYAKAHKIRLQADPEAMARADGFTKAVIHLSLHVRRFILTVESMLQYLLFTIRDLTLEIGRIAANFFKEVFFPLISMISIMCLLYFITKQTKIYINEMSWAALGKIVAGIVGVTVALTVFLGCKAPLRWSRLIENETQLVGWMLPNLMIFFLLLSITLYATGRVLNDPEAAQREMPYRLGPLTAIVSAILAILVVSILVRRRSFIRLAPADSPVPASPAPPSAAATELDSEVTEEEEATAEAQPSWASRQFQSLAGGIRKGAETVGLQDRLKDVRQKVAAAKKQVGKQVGDWLHDKSVLVEEFGKLRGSMDEKNTQLEMLMGLKTTLSPQTFEQRRVQLQSELSIVKREYEQCVLTIHEKAARYHGEIRKVELRLNQTETQLKEALAMIEAGAMSEAEAKDRLDVLKLEKNVLTQKLGHCQQQFDYFKPIIMQLKLEKELGNS